MINEKKFENAMYSLQGALVKARDMAYIDEDKNKLAILLDYLEYLPRMFVSKDDDTEKYSEVIEEISNSFNIQYVADRFNNDIPDKW